MAKLRCESLAERSHVPAFIYFFQMLYPFAWVQRPEARDGGGRRRLHAGASATRSTRPAASSAIRNALIDDCALARRLKAAGPIWLGLTERVRSIRPYTRFADVRPHGRALGLCAAQLFAAAARRHVCRHGADLSGRAAARALRQRLGAHGSGSRPGLLMALSFLPTLRFYRLSPLWGIALPGIAHALCALHVRFRLAALRAAAAAMWKGRVQANAASCDDGRPPTCDPARATGDENFPVASRLIAPRHRPADPGLLRVRARRRRHRRPSEARAPPKSSTLLDRLEAALLGEHDAEPEGVRAARACCASAGCRRVHAQRSAARLPAGRDQAALRELGRPDRLLPLFGDAGRPLRARRARREPQRPGPPTMRCARRCRSSITCRTAPRIIASSIASTFRSTRWRRTALTVEALSAPAARAGAARCLQRPRRAHRDAARATAATFSAQIDDRAPGAGDRRHPVARRPARRAAAGARSLERARASLASCRCCSPDSAGATGGLVRWLLARAAPSSRLRPLSENAMTAAAIEPDGRRDRAPAAARSISPCASCRRRSARRCSRSMRSAARSTTSPTTTRPRAERACGARAVARATSTRSMPARRRRRSHCLAARDASVRPAQARISSPSSTAWRWMSVEDIRAPDLATLDLYCDRVASAVGRLSVRVFGMDEEAGVALAHHLGRALQLTNILRDLDEDAGHRPPLSAARGAARTPASRRPIPRRSLAHPAPRRRLPHGRRTRARRISPRPTRSWRRAPRRAVRGAAHHGARPIAASSTRMVARGLAAAAPARARHASRISSGSCCVTPSSDDRAPSTSSAPGSPASPPPCACGAGRARRRARGDRPGRRPLPLLSRSRTRHGDRQRQPSPAVGQSRRAAPISQAIGAERPA